MNTLGSQGLVIASIPSPETGAWAIGPVPIRAYALAIIAGKGGEQRSIVDTPATNTQPVAPAEPSRPVAPVGQ